MTDIETIRLSDLQPDDRNANKGSERGTYMIRRSLEKLGAGRSILLDKHGKIIAGNKTAESAADVGLDDVVIVRTRGDKLVAVMREDLDLDDPTGQARELAYADNRTGQVSLDWDAEQIGADIAGGVDLGDWFQGWEIEALAGNYTLDNQGQRDTDEDSEGGGGSDGSLLSLVNITIDEPRHIVEAGQVWRVGPHILVCADVLTGWQEWIGFLKDGVIFAPYPGPFVPLTLKAEQTIVVMVQPDTYIAGHILDRYAEINGEQSVRIQA